MDFTNKSGAKPIFETMELLTSDLMNVGLSKEKILLIARNEISTEDAYFQFG